MFWIVEETGEYFGLEEGPPGRFILEESVIEYVGWSGPATISSNHLLSTSDDSKVQTSQVNILNPSDAIRGTVSEPSPQAVEDS